MCISLNIITNVIHARISNAYRLYKSPNTKVYVLKTSRIYTFFDHHSLQFKYHKTHCEYAQNKVLSQSNILVPMDHISITFTMRTDSLTNIGGMVIIMTWLAMYKKLKCTCSYHYFLRAI